MEAWAVTGNMAGGLYAPPGRPGGPALGGSDDRERAVADEHALGGDGLALRLRQPREAELAHAPVARQLVQELAGERHALAARAGVVVAAVRTRGLRAQDGGEVSGHGLGFRLSAPFPSSRLEHSSTRAANCG